MLPLRRSGDTYPLVEYPNIKIDALSVSVAALSKARAKQLIPFRYRLMIASYSSQFEGKGKPLPEGQFAATYGFDHLDDAARTKRLSVYEKRTEQHYKHGGSYHALFHPGQAGRLVGMLKVRPGGVVKKEFAGRYGLAEILVDPEFQHQGLGATLLHASITSGSQHPVTPNQGAVLDAFDDNPEVNEWYGRLGFEPGQPSGQLKLSKEHALNTTYYLTAPGITLASMAQVLETAHPQLALHRTVLLSK